VTPAERPRRAGELAFALGLLGFSLAAFWQAFEISGFSGASTPGVFPMLASGAMAVSALCILRRTLAMPKPTEAPASPLRRFTGEVLPARLVAVLLLVVLYLAAMPWVGFLASSGLFLLATIAFLWRRGFLHSLLLTAVCLGAIYVVFRVVFQVVLPEGTLLRGLF